VKIVSAGMVDKAAKLSCMLFPVVCTMKLRVIVDDGGEAALPAPPAPPAPLRTPAPPFLASLIFLLASSRNSRASKRPRGTSSVRGSARSLCSNTTNSSCTPATAAIRIVMLEIGVLTSTRALPLI
jgi:hypothetical protein